MTDNQNLNSIGSRIKYLRKQKNLTQEELAQIIDKTDNFISKIESNNSSISLKTLIKLVEVLDTSMDFILFDEVKRDESLNDILIKKMLLNMNDDDKTFLINVMQALLSYKKI